MAKQTLTGVVSEVSEKDWKDRETGDNIFLYSFQIEGDKRWFRTGTDNPTFDAGEAIRFAFDTKGNKVDLSTTEVIDESEVEQAPKPRRGAGGAGRARNSGGGGRASSAGRTKPAPKENWDSRAKYWQDKEVRDIEVVEPRITYSAAQRDAITLVTAALANGALSFGKANAAGKLDVLLDYVDNVAERFYDQRFNGKFGAGGTESGNAPDDDGYDEDE